MSQRLREATFPRPGSGSPAVLEELLIRHPGLRIWLMLAGGPYLEETSAILHQYPEIHADISPLDWLLLQAEFWRHVRAQVDAGFADRLKFGSDAIRWLEAIDIAVESMAELSCLTRAQKEALSYGNAPCLFRLDRASGAPCRMRVR